MYNKSKADVSEFELGFLLFLPLCCKRNSSSSLFSSYCVTSVNSEGKTSLYCQSDNECGLEMMLFMRFILSPVLETMVISGPQNYTGKNKTIIVGDYR